MTAQADAYSAALDSASTHARKWLASIGDRPVPPQAGVDELRAALGGTIPDGPSEAADVVDLLADTVEPGLMAIGSGRFFGWVMGGTLPAALAADWLVSAWDQNTGLRYATPAAPPPSRRRPARGCSICSACRPAPTSASSPARRWRTSPGWPPDGSRCWPTSAGTSTASASPARRGCASLVGAERHDTVDLALRYLGLGAPTVVAADEQGRIRLDALAEALDAGSGPTIVCLQAGNLHSGAFDPIAAATALAHEHGAWVHVDGAFGLWAAASPALRHHLAGYEAADSWATDAHKTLNVPYDCGIAIVARPAALRAAFGVHASYLISDVAGVGDPFEKVPELSRRARGVPVWAALRSLGRSGVADLVDGLARHARELAAGIADIDGAEVLNEIDFTQVCVAFGDDARTRDVTARVLADGTAWMSGSRWHDRDVLRISVSNWSTDEDDVRASVDAVRRAVAATSPR